MNKKRLYWTLQIGGWTTFAVLQIIGQVLFRSAEFTGTMVSFYFLEALSCLIVTHGFRSLLVRTGWLSLEFRLLIPRVVVCVIFMGMLVYLLRVLISIPLGLFTTEPAFSVINFAGLSITYGLITFLWSILYLIYSYFERYNLSLKRQAEFNEIELSNLKSQLNPHFIFNSLNGIRALVDEDPKKSKLAITQLSAILRSSLASGQNKLTAFDDELLTVKNYLGLESIRYEERLRVHYDIDPRSSGFQVPPLMLQTLVENGIKHGISELKEGGEINIKTEVDKDLLKIDIRNSGQYKKQNGSTRRRKGGLGLINTRRRLALIYGESAHLEIKNVSETEVSTEVTIPLNKLEYESNNH